MKIIDKTVCLMEERDKTVAGLRVRIVGFRDFMDPLFPAIVESPFFELPADKEKFIQLLNSLEAKGGCDIPENALEALALAFKSQWTQAGQLKRHIVFLITNAPTLMLGERKDYPGYPSGMPKDMNELLDLYGTLDNNAKRLIIVAPEDYNFNTFEFYAENCICYSVEEFFENLDTVVLGCFG